MTSDESHGEIPRSLMSGSMIGGLRRVRVVRVADIASGIKEFELVSATGEPLPEFSPGAHIVISMRHEDQSWRKPYSIMKAADRNGYVIAVRHASEARGGSWYLHTHVQVGSELDISEPVNFFPLARNGHKHILIAGGIGITPMLSMLDELKRGTIPFELHYAVRSEESGVYLSELKTELGSALHVYCSNRGQLIPLNSVLDSQPAETHVYVCGPRRMVDAVIKTARRAGWPKAAIHCEGKISTSLGRTSCGFGGPPGRRRGGLRVSFLRQREVVSHSDETRHSRRFEESAPLDCRTPSPTGVLP